MTANILDGPKVTTIVNFNTLGQFFLQLGKQHDDKICQINMDTNEQESYASVLKRSTRVALAMQELGITAKDVVVCCSFNSMNNIIPILAAFYLGAKVNNLDPKMQITQYTHLLQLTSPTIIFVDEECVTDIEESLRKINFKTRMVVLGSSTKYDTLNDFLKSQEGEEEFQPIDINENEVAIMFFTSGTTGLPKAICHSHFGFLNHIVTADHFDVDLHFTPFSWISAMLILSRRFLTGEPRIFGNTIVGDDVFKCIEKYKVRALFMAPIYSYELTNVENPEKYKTNSLRTFTTGGNPLQISQMKKLKTIFTNCSITVFYGMTEAGFIASFDGTKDQKLMETKIGSCGKVSAGTKLKIVDPLTGDILGPNQKGEIYVKNSCLLVGYYRKDSSKEFDADGFLKTGDVGYYDEDQCIYIVDRSKDIFKYKCFHIAPSVIEKVLLEHPAVREAVVFGGVPMGEEGFYPTACVVLKGGYSEDTENIGEFVGERVLDREKLRGGIFFLNKLPRTATGKVIRQAVRNLMIKL